MIYGLPDNMVQMIAAATYGENRGQGQDAILHTASSIFNRLGQNEWKHMSVPQVLQNGYYAVSHPENNQGFTDAMSGKFKDKASENDFKRIYATVASLNRGSVEPKSTQFYFKQNEINKLIKNKGFDFSKVNEGESFNAKVGGKTVKFRTFSYK
jgi:hypothetical protein